jgi:pyruvate/2-oxoglutarate dehydrogenase complex dihydrolipoamide acyltransferase (E2) component
MSRDVIMPALGMAQKTGLIVRWLKQAGDPVKAGDVLMEVETDKAMMEVEADADGTLTDVSAAAGEEVPVGEVIARIADGSVAAAAPAARAPATPPAVKSPPAERTQTSTPVRTPAVAAAPAPSPSPSPSKNGRFFASPRARRLAAEQGLDLAKLAEAGRPQPYLVQHLAELRALAPEPAGGATFAATAPSAPPLRLTATLAKDGLAEFCAWRRAETGAPTEEIAVMAGMAAAAFRPSASNAELVVAAYAFGAARSFVNADRSGLGSAKAVDTPANPALVLRDLRGAAVTDLSLGAEAAPTLSVMRRGVETFITLECAPAQLRPEAAIELISEFAGRLAEPLRHLL